MRFAFKQFALLFNLSNILLVLFYCLSLPFNKPTRISNSLFTSALMFFCFFNFLSNWLTFCHKSFTMNIVIGGIMKKRANQQQADEVIEEKAAQTEEVAQTEETTQNEEAPQNEVSKTEEAPQTVQAAQPVTKSKFTGGAFANFFINLAAKFVTLITLGILYPFMATWKEKWMAKHTYINGRQLEFDGNGFQFWGRYMLWWLLSVVTLGVYYVVFMSIGVSKWRTKHLHYVDTPEEQRNSYFDGRWYQLLGVKLLSGLVKIETLFIASLWSVCFKQRWTCSHQVIDGQRLNFDGGGLQLYGRYLLWMFLTIITLGIYSFWFTIGVKKWVISHTDNKGTEEREKINKEEEKELICTVAGLIPIIGIVIGCVISGTTGRFLMTMFMSLMMLWGALLILEGIARWFKNRKAGRWTPVAAIAMAVGWMLLIISVFLRIFIRI